MLGAETCGASTVDANDREENRRVFVGRGEMIEKRREDREEKRREEKRRPRRTDVFDAVAREDHVPSHEILLRKSVKVEFTVGICLPLDLSLDGIKVDRELGRLEKSVKL